MQPFIEFNIEELIKSHFECRYLKELLLKYKEKGNSMVDGRVGDFYSGVKFKYWKQHVIPNDFDLCLLMNIDGTPLAESSKSNVWLIQTKNY